MDEIIGRYYHAKRYISRNSGKITLRSWENGKFRATVSENTDLREGMEFFVKVDVNLNNSNNDLSVGLVLGTVWLEQLEEMNDNDMYDARFTISEWKSEKEGWDNQEQNLLSTYLPKIKNNDRDIDPYLTVREPDELKLLSLDEWQCLYRGLEKVGHLDPKR